jgi:hypothetical protein
MTTIVDDKLKEFRGRQAGKWPRVTTVVPRENIHCSDIKTDFSYVSCVILIVFHLFCCKHIRYPETIRTKAVITVPAQ